LFAWPHSLHLVQLSLNLVHCLAQLAYLFTVSPYLERRTNLQEIFNELCILAVACLLFGLTDQVTTDFKTRMRISWAITFIIIAQVILNLCLVIYVWLVGVREAIERCRNKRRAAKYDEKSMTEMSDLKINKRFGTIAESN
jgi:predicted membrane protein